MEKLVSITYEGELEVIARHTLDFENTETGGDLFGFWTKDSMPIIKYVTGPGKNTSRSATSFFQDIPYLHQCGHYFHDNFALEHIGSWHSHHKLGIEKPSEGDINTMRNCLLNKGIERFFIAICVINNRKEVTINGFLFSNEFVNIHKQTNWIILPNESPFRKQIDNNTRFIVHPNTKKSIYKVVMENNSNCDNKINTSEKVELPNDSFFSTEAGRKFLKQEYEKISSRIDCTDVELIQNDDQTIGISFKLDGKEIEIRYPVDFSEKNPNPVIIEKNDKNETKRHLIAVEPVKMYFISTFDIFSDIFRLIFISKNDDKNDSITNINID
ncbi:MAG: hypothetical protein PHT69_17050 [Bacteroidales bacterium]|nr:hypothetical protein [Bacteroidales bacterium]